MPSPSSGHAPTMTLYDPPSPHSRRADDRMMDRPPPVPDSLGAFGFSPSRAGPSSERITGLDMDLSYGAEPDVPFSPSSAPPTSSARGITHPPEFIHTHHPRRGSMTPLGLNVISPKPPVSFPHGGPAPTFQSPFPTQRSVGFNPIGAAQPDSSPTIMGNTARRSSAASTTSTLTQSRPITQSQYPPGFNRERRRSSLTPHAGLAPPSPSRHMATGRNSRPSSSDGSGAPVHHLRTRTEPPSKTLGAGSRDQFTQGSDEFGRRGSMPHLAYGAYGGSSSRQGWNPSLPPQRGSVGEEAMPEEGFRFGSIPSGPASPATAALRAIELSPSGRRLSVQAGMGEKRDVFAEAEAEEAEKQRRAFMAATYGVDGKRARERLSIGGQPTTPHGSPGNSMRRPSLMLWEKLGMAAAQRVAEAMEVGSASAPTLPTLNPIAPFEDAEMLGQRRGSLPIAIPGGLLGRSSSRREQKEARVNDMDAPLIVQTDVDADQSEDEEEQEADEQEEEGSENLSAPVRPLPPLLPLSDPGPRLLPSTLALHRASHLLNARNLQPEPLPHPLPPSLHPPAPIDLAEFDIDFILAGSRAQLGGDKKIKNAPVDTLIFPFADASNTPTLQLGPGGEDEDTFAKFVGEFDDEYGCRRGDWTFRSCGASTPIEELRDPLDTAASREAVKAEWESQGAGRYELYGNGEIRSVKSGSVWRVRRSGPREYELEEKRRGLLTPSPSLSDSATVKTVRPTVVTGGAAYCLTGKTHHNESGGIKFASSTLQPRKVREMASRSNSSGGLPPPRAAQMRASISDASPNSRSAQTSSGDSGFSGTGRQTLSQSAPLGNAINAILPKKKRQGSKDLIEGDDPRGRPSVSFANKSEASTSGKKTSDKSPSGDRGEKEKKKSGGLGGVLKRGLASIKHSSSLDEKKSQREEKESERAQSQSWSGALSSHRDSPTWIHPSGRPSNAGQGHSTRQFFSHPTASRKNSNTATPNTPSQKSIDERGVPLPDDRSSEVLIDDDALLKREGKGWAGVPEDAVAMVIPIESEGPNGPAGIANVVGWPNLEGHRQALLVWFVPFNSDVDKDKDDRPTLTHLTSTASSLPMSTSSIDHSPSTSSSSLPKFQKLLRRRASREKDGLRAAVAQPPTPNPGSHVSFSSDLSGRQHPLPFRSFRVVARVVDWDDLRSPSDVTSPLASNSLAFDQWAERNPQALGGTRTASTAGSSTQPSPHRPLLTLTGSSGDTDIASTSTAPTSTIMSGRTFPTVIAVCHSRSQGVEFVLEGLDRLGFCQGESAWGPTGYEEWRGSGLSEKGRELLDLLWAGCVAVLGIAV